MKEYIEINKNTFPTPFSKRLNGYMQGWNDCLNSVLQHKTADVEPVRRGKWKVKGQDIYCSVCDGESAYNPFGASKFSNYCPNCGAKMKED